MNFNSIIARSIYYVSLLLGMILVSSIAFHTKQMNFMLLLILAIPAVALAGFWGLSSIRKVENSPNNTSEYGYETIGSKCESCGNSLVRANTPQGIKVTCKRVGCPNYNK